MLSSRRTVVYVLTLIEEDGAYYWVGVSTTHPDKPDEPKKFVRYEIHQPVLFD